MLSLNIENKEFQHTATRRWLPTVQMDGFLLESFNTQPPEGGCVNRTFGIINFNSFNTQPPEGGCKRRLRKIFQFRCFNTQPPEGGCFQ